MIAAAAYFAYKEHQKTKEKTQQRQRAEEVEHRRDQGDQPSSPGHPVEASSSSPSPWFASLPLEEATLNCYFSSEGEQNITQHQGQTTFEMRNGETSTTADDRTDLRNMTTTNQTMPVLPSPLETTTFQEIVRKEWIQAVFGTEFPSKSKDDTDISPQTVNANNHSCIKSAWKGVGLSQLPYYTTYTVELPPLDTQRRMSMQQQSPCSTANDEKKDAMTKPIPKLGMTLSRLALGLYVRHVHPGSEAWCAGVQPNSILVSINHGTINLLAEPTKAALERIWQYEGFGACLEYNLDSRTTASRNNASVVTTTTDSQMSPMAIQEPICMTFMLHGRQYDVLFLSNPPYGIDWAPCGNFCLVKKVTSERANEAGVLPSSIVAGISMEEVNNNPNTKASKVSLYDLDCETGASTLQRAAMSNRPVHIQFCFPPTTARSGHWERLQDAKLKERENTRNSRILPSSSNTAGGSSPFQRPKVAVEIDGVQVRIHPLLSGGILRRANSQTDQWAPSLVALSGFAAKVASGEPLSVHFSSEKLVTSTTTWRSRSDRIFRTSLLERENAHAGSSLERRYRPCPPLEMSLLQCWGAKQAITYLCMHHLVNYDERKTFCSAAEDWNVTDLLRTYDKVQAFEVVETFLLIWVALLSSNDNRPLNLAQCLLELAMQHVVLLAHPMEFLAGAFGNEELKQSLGKLRAHRLRLVQQRQIQRQLDGKEASTPGNRKSRQSQKASMVESKVGEHSRPVPPSTVANRENKEGLKTEACSSKKKTKKLTFRVFRKFKRSGRKQKHDLKETSQVVIESQSDVKEKHQPDSADEREPISQSTTQDSMSANSLLNRDLASNKVDDLFAKTSHPDSIFSNSFLFLEELKSVCEDIEKNLLQSFSQKFTRWALQPWTPSKETALAQVTHAMRERLKICNQNEALLPLINPVDTSEALLAIDAVECFVLPSAHFPLLLTFDCQRRAPDHSNDGQKVKSRRAFSSGNDFLYRTIVELVELRGSRPKQQESSPRAFWIHGSVAGSVLKSERSVGIDRFSNCHVWDTGNTLVFDSLSSWGPPKTLSLRLTEAILDTYGEERIVSSKQTDGNLAYEKECGFCWIDLEPFWERSVASRSGIVTVKTQAVPSDAYTTFDEHGDLFESSSVFTGEHETIEIELRVTTKVVQSGTVRRSLLYKHDDDVRQEMFAIAFIKSCDRIWRSCGLDMKILTFAAIPVGGRQGFIEWIYGSVALSEICQPFGGSILEKRKGGGSNDVNNQDKGYDSDDNTMSSVAKAGMTKYESLHWMQSEGLGQKNSNNPIQDYLRSNAYDPDGPFKIKKEVMDTYAKSCAGYTICTYLLGVGDRHLDNLLLHQSGHLFHCDYSFILGNDPKKYLPMRITKDMVNGMGGPSSDNFCQFLSLAGAAFLTLRRPENVRHLLSLLRVMEGSGLPDLEGTQTLEDAISGLRNRLRLDLDDDGAINFMEKLIEDSCSSKIWMAVDAIHSLAQRF